MISTMTLRDIALIAGIVFSVLGCIKVLLEIRTKMADWRASTTAKTSLLRRNWAMLLVCAASSAVMFASAQGPVTPASVLFCVIGGVLASFALTGIVVLEAARLSTTHIWDALELQAKAQQESTQRIVSVLRAVALQPKRATDEPD